MTVGELQRQLELCDPDMEVRLYLEYKEERLKVSGDNILKRIHQREVFKHLDEVKVGEHAIILEGLSD